MQTTMVSDEQQLFMSLFSQLSKQILGQEKLLQRLLIALIADGHLLVEGAPGLAKTTAIKALGAHIDGDFHRIQFTPDLLPSDITGTEIYRPQEGSFTFQPGPIFHNIILTDEINRAPAKVQSALLEAMGERQVSYGKATYPLPELFLVMATQNPIEQEGTYPLPEAQLDRFLMYINIDYPESAVEQQILQLARQRDSQQLDLSPTTKLSQTHIFKARKAIFDVHLSPALEQYMVQIIMATRKPLSYGEQFSRWIRYGASPRGTISLDRCARAYAWLAGKDFVAPEDIHAIALDVLRHRVLLSYEAQAEGVTSDEVITELLRHIPIP